MASNDNNAFLSPYGTQIKKEADLASGTALPGDILNYSGADVLAGTTAESTGPVIIADLSVSVAGGKDEPYNTTTNTRVNYKIPQRGELVRFNVGASTTFVIGDEISTSSVSGVVKVAAVAGVAVIAIAKTAIVVGGGATGTVIGEVI